MLGPESDYAEIFPTAERMNYEGIAELLRESFCSSLREQGVDTAIIETSAKGEPWSERGRVAWIAVARKAHEVIGAAVLG